ncbi:MAG: lipid II flippase MurJ [Armatimonadota bacterium]|nr:hypothetical protein [Armatimonadota bacterium]MCX7778326.1 hypothetical protein [Armatimonadota bacterium]MDW8026395.1 lipid II flippase MurJ [Armatimonadota bacterium]
MSDEGAILIEEAREVVDRRKGIVKYAAVVSGFRALNPILGILREVIMAHFLGVKAGADIYRFVVDRVLVELYTKVEKLLQPTFLPLFVARQTLESDAAAFRFANVMGTLLALILAVIAFAGAFWADKFTAIMLHYLHEDVENFQLAVLALRFTFPFLVFYCLSNLLELLLQSYANFTLPALAETLRRVCVVVGFGTVALITRHPTQSDVVIAAILGAIAGIMLRLLVQLPGLRGKVRYMRPSLQLSNPDLIKAGILMVPLIAGVMFALARSWGETLVAGRIGEGMLAALGYARKLLDQPWQIIAYAVSVVIYPFISELSAKRERSELAESLLSVFRIMVFVFVPTTIIMMALAGSLARGLLGFKGEDLKLVLSALLFYLPGLTIFALEEPTLKWFYALGNTLVPTLLGILADFVFFAVLLSGVFVFEAGLPAFALALVISKTLKVLIVYAILHFWLGGLPWGKLKQFVVHMLITSLALSLFMALLHMLTPSYEAKRLLHLAIALSGSLIGYAFFGVSAWVLRMPEAITVGRFLWDAFRRRLSKVLAISHR